ncbi:prion-like protein doppel [Pontoporia blainvillei]|uniref:Prion-like protein doppel n=1 Tax=Pontoporia blainvillei TaxID=48723 RepID=A0ABX0S7B3_PONBL|nr:prion-like protein doppel [Pontoporia blainvillei]
MITEATRGREWQRGNENLGLEFTLAHFAASPGSLLRMKGTVDNEGVIALTQYMAPLTCSSQLSSVKARGIKHRIKWNQKALPSISQVTEAHTAEIRPGAFIKQGQKLDIIFGAEGNRYYEANNWQFPDGIHYNGCSEANVTKEKFVTSCISATQAVNQEELTREKQDNNLYQRVLWQLIRELCSNKQCDFWLERGAGLRVTLDQPMMLCLLVFIWFIVK